MKKTALIAALSAASSLSFLITPSQAEPGHDHGHDHAQASAISIPESQGDLWKVIQAEHASLREAVESRSDAAAHTAEEKLQAYLKALPEKLKDLEEGVRRRIEGQARNLARAYDSVHHAADDKAWDKAAAEMKKAEGGMKLLAAQMP